MAMEDALVIGGSVLSAIVVLVILGAVIRKNNQKPQYEILREERGPRQYSQTNLRERLIVKGGRHCDAAKRRKSKKGKKRSKRSKKSK